MSRREPTPFFMGNLPFNKIYMSGGGDKDGDAGGYTVY